VQNMTQFAMTQLNSGWSSPNYHRTLCVHRAQSQVVAGIKWYLTLTIGETTCSKQKHGSALLGSTDLAKCPLSASSTPFKCEVEILSQPWTGVEATLIKSCQPGEDSSSNE